MILREKEDAETVTGVHDSAGYSDDRNSRCR